MPASRPSIYTSELCKAICKKIRSGKTLYDISKLPSMPCRATMYKWRAAKPEFDAALLKAEKCRDQFWMDEIKHLSKIEKKDLIVRDNLGRVVINGALVNARDLAIRSTQWLLTIASPQKYRLNARKFEFPTQGTSAEQLNAVFDAVKNGCLAVSEVPALVSAISVKQQLTTVEDLNEKVGKIEELVKQLTK